MIISIASGKGGTGKTTVAVNIALSLKNVQLIDCDVEEPNDAIFLKPQIEKTESVSLPLPEVDLNKCDYCGICADVCAFKAINVFKPISKEGNVLFLPHLCHNCGACAMYCPKKAISEKQKQIGIIEIGRSGSIEYVCGKLDIGEIKSPQLIREVKKKINKNKTVILDCPPGTSCPMMNAVKGSDFCLLVTEPTPFGLHDLNLAVETVKKMRLKFGVLVNRATDSRIIDDYCEKMNIVLLGSIPFDKEIAKLYSKGDAFLLTKDKYKSFFIELIEKIKVHCAVKL